MRISTMRGGVRAMSDGFGGAMLFINPLSSDAGRNIYAKKIDHYGNLQWSGEEVEICRVPLDQVLNACISDSSGGAIVGWRDFRRSIVPHWIFDSVDVYVQRVDFEGNVLWGENGMDLRTPKFGRRNMWIGEMVEDGQGGAIVQFSLEEGFYGEWENYVQRIDRDGNLLWGEDAVAVDTTNTFHHRYFAGMVTDGEGGVIVGQIGGYTSSENFYYFIRINSAGEKIWHSDTLWFNGYTFINNIVNDGYGGAYFFYQTNPDTSEDIIDFYINQIGQDGNLMWAGLGTKVSNRSHGELGFPFISITPTSDVIFIYEAQLGEYPVWDSNIFGQKLNTIGEVLWDSGGVVINEAVGNQVPKSIVAALDGGIFVVWTDTRNYDSNGIDIYAQRLDASGESVWTYNGKGISVKPGYQDFPDITSDGSDGVIIAWDEFNTPTGFGTYAQQVNGAGQLGVPGPLSVEDNVLIPVEFYVSSFPNPFNTSATILYDLPHPDKVSSTIYNIEGKEVIKLFEGKKEKGKYKLLWNGTDEKGIPVASGLYLFRINGENLTETHKMLLLR
ncbi:MAG: T9SS type A sorting domain-containing protein [Fidelibacterota bacterium]